MPTLFSPDSPIMKTMTRLGELVILNLLYLVTCIPIFTIGAATAALYDTCFRLGTERENRIYSVYFRGFKSNFKQATICFLTIAAFLAGLTLIVMLTLKEQGICRLISLTALILMMLVLLASGYVFPLISRFHSETAHLMKNAFLVSVVYFPRSLCILLLNLLPILLFFFYPFGFLYGIVAWLYIYFSTAAYINSRLLKKVFAPSIHESEEENDSTFMDTSR